MMRTRLYRRRLRSPIGEPTGHDPLVPEGFTGDPRWEKIKQTARALEALGLEWEIALRASKEMHR